MEGKHIPKQQHPKKIIPMIPRVEIQQLIGMLLNHAGEKLGAVKNTKELGGAASRDTETGRRHLIVIYLFIK
jgi:hypothetical protein